MKRIDLTGRKFGRLSVLGYSHSHIQPSKQKRAIWNVECECGVKKTVSTANLTGKKSSTISCGCYFKELLHKGMRKTSEMSEFKTHYSLCKGRSNTDKKEFDISFDEYVSIIVNNCEYCGIEPPKRFYKSGKDKKIKCHGIDRVDNEKGYVAGNCVSCCARCNQMKSILTVESFLNHIKRILNHVEKKQISQSIQREH